MILYYMVACRNCLLQLFTRFFPVRRPVRHTVRRRCTPHRRCVPHRAPPMQSGSGLFDSRCAPHRAPPMHDHKNETTWVMPLTKQYPRVLACGHICIHTYIYIYRYYIYTHIQSHTYVFCIQIYIQIISEQGLRAFAKESA